jgi:hypothetical protein
MYGQVIGASTTVAGVALLPNTGSRKVLFTIALSLLAIGVVTFVASTAIALKQRSAKA